MPGGPPPHLPTSVCLPALEPGVCDDVFLGMYQAWTAEWSHVLGVTFLAPADLGLRCGEAQSAPLPLPASAPSIPPPSPPSQPAGCGAKGCPHLPSAACGGRGVREGLGRDSDALHGVTYLSPSPRFPAWLFLKSPGQNSGGSQDPAHPTPHLIHSLLPSPPP